MKPSTIKKHSSPKPKPVRLSDVVRKSICDNVRVHMIPPPVAAESVGTTYRTFQSWMKRGAADDFAGVESEYARLYRDVCRAAADAQVSAQKRLLKSTDRVESDNLKWFLERWDRDTWGAQVVIKVQNEIRQAMAIELLSLVRETLDDESTYRAVESRLLEEGDRGEKGAAK